MQLHLEPPGDVRGEREPHRLARDDLFLDVVAVECTASPESVLTTSTTLSPSSIVGRWIPPCGTPLTTLIVTTCVCDAGVVAVVCVVAVVADVVVGAVAAVSVVVTAPVVPLSPPHPARAIALAATAASINAFLMGLLGFGRTQAAARRWLRTRGAAAAGRGPSAEGATSGEPRGAESR